MRLRKTTKVDLIRNVSLFERCSKDELGRIAQASDELALPAGAVLMREGERGREFVVVVEGTLVARKGDVVLGRMGPGDFAGEIALVADVPRTATVAAETPVRLLVLSDRAFQAVIRDSPSIATKVLAVLGARLHASGA